MSTKKSSKKSKKKSKKKSNKKDNAKIVEDNKINENINVEEEKKEEKWIANPSELDGVPDLSQLIYLDMPNVLRNLKYRYCSMSRKFCYTSISSILLAINPYEYLPIYGHDVIDEFHHGYLKGKLITNRPHPYSVSCRSYMRMTQRKSNQSIIVCGESGAGKTETTKLLMRYLAMTAPSSSSSTLSTTTSTVEEQIIAASPILEAYGNAKTVMNNNSSRFGKFTKLLYDNGRILGSTLETYLLEKSRVAFQSLNERNYHIFYFLYYGIDKNKHKLYGLNEINKFNYINQGKCFNSYKDSERFTELCESLNLFRIDDNIQDILWKITSGICNLGNVNFKRTGDGFTEIKTSDDSIKHLNIVSDLWGIKKSDLKKRLTTSSVTINKQVITKKIQFTSAISNRDSISKGIYENIFLWIVKRINAELLIEDDDDDDDDDGGGGTNDNGDPDDSLSYFIGILDVFGFENFYINSLEQFCINYTNEKLQQYFNYHIIRSEQEEYLSESVFWKPLRIPDNKNYIKLIEDKKIGFFILLDSACKGPSQNDTVAFMQTLFNKHSNNITIHKRTKPGDGDCRGKPKKTKKKKKLKISKKFDGFMINHFADDVCYDITGFLLKNMESVHSDTNKMIKKSNQLLFKQINNVDGIKNKKSKKKKTKKKSVTAVFHAGIKKLMKNLNKTEPYFVRCINPNQQKSSKVWNEKLVKHQLKCGGLLEALKVLKLGYPTRVPYKLLYEKYHPAVTNNLIKNMNEESFSTSLLIAFDVERNDYELGLTKIFFKPSKAAILDTIMNQAGKPLTVEQNNKITEYIVGKRINQLLGIVKSFTKTRKIIRLKRATDNWRFGGRIASILGGSILKHLTMARQRILARKQKQGSILMQSYFRGMYQRNIYLNQIKVYRESVCIIWKAYCAMQQKNGLIKWVNNKVNETRIKKEQERIRKEKEEQERIRKEKERIEKERLRIEAERIRKEKEQLALLADKERKLKEEQLEKERIERERIIKLKKEKEEKEEKERIRIETEKIEKEKEKERIRIETEKQKLLQASLQRQSTQELLAIEKQNKIKKKEEYNKILQKEINKRKEQQDIGETKQKKRKKQNKLKNRYLAKIQKQEHIKENALARQKEDDVARKIKYRDKKKKELHRKYGSLAVMDFVASQKHLNDLSANIDNDLKDSDSTGEYDSSDDDLNSLLARFNSIAAMGQLFHRHTNYGSKRHKNKPHDRVVKVVFSGPNYRPIEISWGSGTRKILFKNILYVTWGHYTPVFHRLKDLLDPINCMSVVGKKQILDLEGYNKSITELWVKGLRQLIGLNDKKCDKLSKENLKNLIKKEKDKDKDKLLKNKKNHNNDRNSRGNNINKIRGIIEIQKDLFIMSTHAVFRKLEEEKCWNINFFCRQLFTPTNLYPIALKKDIPWKQWQSWIRNQITDYLMYGKLSFELHALSLSIAQMPRMPNYNRNMNLNMNMNNSVPPQQNIRVPSSSTNNQANQPTAAEEEKCELM